MRYNAACLYSLVLGHEEIDSRLKKHCISAALEQLTLALSDPASAESRNWALENDPDLKHLRATTDWGEWKDYFYKLDAKPGIAKQPVPKHPSDDDWMDSD